MRQIHFLTILINFLERSSQALNQREDRNSGRILYGEEDAKDSFAYVVALSTSEVAYAMYKGTRIFRGCTGSLISPYWVITAAHCITPAVVRILYGDMTVFPTHESASHSEIIKKYPHPRYKITQSTGIIQEFLSNDIGLVLVEKVDLQYYGKLSAVDYKTLVGAPVEYTGLGITFRENFSLQQSMTLKEDQKRKRQIGQAVVIPCKTYIEYEVFPSICLASKCSNRHQTIARGDSGGPVLSAGKIVGVASTVIKNNDSRFTAVSPFLEWIGRVMKEEENN